MIFRDLNSLQFLSPTTSYLNGFYTLTVPAGKRILLRQVCGN
ncbi:hypothetical protein PC113_g5062 [Phytophthora cactorum]|uniref:Uncharacterized protein n=1 Tax=Phytophthora cactorum TaxID=29920 RepID=A0A8T0ZNM2_9STRA|nr:hypothetical protein PC113_g5062 [Phytophthora cactorum]